MSSKAIDDIVEVGLVVAAVAVNVIPGVGQVLSAAMITAITSAGLAAGIALTESVLLGPGSQNVGAATNTQADRLYASLTTTEPRKAALGHTAFATDIRYDTYTGDNQDHYQTIVGCACHKVASIDEIWFDNELAWTSDGGVQGRYVGFLTVDAVTEGTRDNGIAIDGTWTADCTLTGCAYVHFDYLLVGPDQNTPSPFQGGVTNRITVIGNGALLYDPRKDSTVTGGSGDHRADDQSTWEWDDDACNNPVLQELFYELGWKINGVLSVGRGVLPARLLLEDYITTANLCDEAVALKAGGSEPRYRSAGVVSEGDDPKSVRAAICSAMNAEMRDSGARVSLQILYDDLADIVCDFGADDILTDGDYDEAPSLDQYFNVVRGRCIDPSSTSLYQLTDYPQQSVPSPDGMDRIESFDLPMVESATQAQRLAKLHLMRKQFQGTYGPTLGPRAWRAAIGRNVTVTHPVLPWDSKIFRSAGQSVNDGGPTKMALIEEDPSIYAWDPETDEQSAITAGAPTVYNPSNNPMLPPSPTSLILSNSYPAGLRVNAADAGDGTATITLDGGSDGADFAMDYGTTPRQVVDVPAGTLTGNELGIDYYLFADVTGPLDPAPVYGATPTYGDALNSAAHPLRIYLNQFIGTPASGDPPTGGAGYGGGIGSGSGGGPLP